MNPIRYGGLGLCLTLAALSAATQTIAGAALNLAAPQVGRQILYVNEQTGDDTWDGLCPTWESGTCGPKRTILAGLDSAADGDEVVVASGTYTGSGNHDLNFLGKAVTLRSDSGDPASCIIDCARQGRGFNFQSGETADTVVQGFTIRNGMADAGAAVYCDGGSNPTLVNCVLAGNTASNGGALACWDSSPALTNCTLIDNTADQSGGAASCSGGSPTLTNCSLVCDSALAHGGGVFCDACPLALTNCTLTGNTARGAAPACIA